jgi:hypothetical protein
MIEDRTRLATRRSWCVLLVILCAGCAGGTATSYLHPTVDFSHIHRCAVVPYQNLTQDNFADERLQSAFLSEVLHDGKITMLDPEETASAMRGLKISEGSPLAPEQFVALGKALNVEGIFFGTVEEYGVSRNSRRPIYEVTASFGLAETETGNLIWRSRVHADGSSFWKKIFGGESASLYSVSRKAVRAALGSLF